MLKGRLFSCRTYKPLLHNHLFRLKAMILFLFIINGSHDSSVGIAMGYGLDGQGICFQFQAEARDTLLHKVQTRSETHRASYQMDSFAGNYAARAFS
jgi:hypothetical protein